MPSSKKATKDPDPEGQSPKNGKRKSTDELNLTISKCQRSTRCSAPSYDQKHHPMDDYLRPKTAAKRQTKNTQTAKTAVIEDKPDFENPKPENNGDSVTQENQEVEQTKSDHTKVSNSVHETIRRRSSRCIKAGNGIILNYDQSHHPLDNFIRPKAVAKKVDRKLSFLEVATPSEQAPAQEETRTPVSATTTIAPGPSEGKQVNRCCQRCKGPGNQDNDQMPCQHFDGTNTNDQNATGNDTRSSKNPFRDSEVQPTSDRAASTVAKSLLLSRTEPKALDWNKLDYFDRRLYQLQKGAPTQGETLPLAWSEVKQILFDEGLNVTLDVVSSIEGTESTKSRYEEVRLGLEAFFATFPEMPKKEDWLVLRAEGFDVFDKKRGSRYWKPKEKNIIKPIIEMNEAVQPVNLARLCKQAPATFDDSRQAFENRHVRLGTFESSSTLHGDVQETLDDNAPERTPEDAQNKFTNERGPTGVSEQTLVELMRTIPSASAEVAADEEISMADIEALFDEFRYEKDDGKNTMKGTGLRLAIPKFPAKEARLKRRKQRQQAADFTIYEDENEDRYPRPLQFSPASDVPVENMSSSQYSASSALGLSRRGRQRSPSL